MTKPEISHPIFFQNVAWSTKECFLKSFFEKSGFAILIVSKHQLKPLDCNNKVRRIKFHRYVCQFLQRDHGGFGHKMELAAPNVVVIRIGL